MQKITLFLWFDNNAKAAMLFYATIFKHSKIGHIAQYGERVPRGNATFMTGTIEITGQEITVLNGGPQFTFAPAISFL